MQTQHSSQKRSSAGGGPSHRNNAPLVPRERAEVTLLDALARVQFLTQRSEGNSVLLSPVPAERAVHGAKIVVFFLFLGKFNEHLFKR